MFNKVKRAAFNIKQVMERDRRFAAPKLGHFTETAPRKPR